MIPKLNNDILDLSSDSSSVEGDSDNEEGSKLGNGYSSSSTYEGKCKSLWIK